MKIQYVDSFASNIRSNTCSGRDMRIERKSDREIIKSAEIYICCVLILTWIHSHDNIDKMFFLFVRFVHFSSAEHWNRSRSNEMKFHAIYIQPNHSSSKSILLFPLHMVKSYSCWQIITSFHMPHKWFDKSKNITEKC